MKSTHLKTLLLLFMISLTALTAADPEFRLTYSVFFPSTHIHTRLAEEWAYEVNKRTNGRVVIDIYPGGVLSGAGENYECVVKGVSDLGMSCFSYSRGMFPMMEGLDLPLGYRDGRQATRIANAYVRHFHPAELAETKVLYVHAHGPGVIASRKKINSVSHLKGLSIRGTGISALIIRELGGNAIGMGQPDTYEALRKGVVDATLCPIETLKGWRQGEVINYVTRIPAAGYTTAMFVVMNRDTWHSLPPDIQAVITEVSEEWIAKHGEMWNVADEEGTEFILSMQKDIGEIDKSEDDIARAMLAPILEQWAQGLEERGLPGNEALNFIRTNLALPSDAPLPPLPPEDKIVDTNKGGSWHNTFLFFFIMLVIAGFVLTMRGGRVQAAFWQTYRVCVLKLAYFMAAISGITLLVIIAITIADIIGRRLGHPILGAMDLVQILICLSTACAMPYVTALKGHIAVEFFFQRLSPVKQIFWDTINRLAAITFFTYLALTCIRHGSRLLEQKAVALSLGIPLFWVLWVMGGAFFLMLLVIIYNINHPGREMTRP